MIRHAAAVAVALCLSSSLLSAQIFELTVTTASAPVHRAPSIGSSVVGHATAGARLEIMRDVGDWVKIAWPPAPDGIGYIRKIAGAITQKNLPVVSRIANPTAAEPVPVSATRLAAQVEPVSLRPQTAPTQPSFVSVPTHVLGLGGQVGGAALGAGISARVWPHQRFGVQFDVSRYSMTDTASVTRMNSTQFGPRVLYALRDHVSDYVWWRPYAGAGAHLYRSTLTDSSIGLSMSDSRIGGQVFVGAEMTLSNVPRFGLSADVGYNWLRNPYALYSYALDGMAFTAAGHWYVK